MRSPIEMMVDKACGVPADWKPEPHVMLHCPQCDKTKSVEKDETDPEATARIELHCPDCNQGDLDYPEYFDANGKQILEF